MTGKKKKARVWLAPNIYRLKVIRLEKKQQSSYPITQNGLSPLLISAGKNKQSIQAWSRTETYPTLDFISVPSALGCCVFPFVLKLKYNT